MLLAAAAAADIKKYIQFICALFICALPPCLS
jgi:hypothetical protein